MMELALLLLVVIAWSVVLWRTFDPSQLDRDDPHTEHKPFGPGRHG